MHISTTFSRPITNVYADLDGHLCWSHFYTDKTNKDGRFPSMKDNGCSENLKLTIFKKFRFIQSTEIIQAQTVLVGF